MEWVTNQSQQSYLWLNCRQYKLQKEGGEREREKERQRQRQRDRHCRNKHEAGLEIG